MPTATGLWKNDDGVAYGMQTIFDNGSQLGM
jgi:hypothetical protein